MRVVVSVGKGVAELNWTWLPTFIGMDSFVRKEMREVVRQFEGQELTEEVLDQAHKAVCAFLQERYATIHGLAAYLDGLKAVTLEP